MSAPFIGEVIMFGGNFAPRSWAFCDGQQLAIAQNAALFSLLGTTYGGDGRNTFGLPDLRGRTPVHAGQGPGLSNYKLGQKGGVENVGLQETQMPSHTHTLRASSSALDAQDPSNHVLAETPAFFYGPPTNVKGMASDSLASTGGGQTHVNEQPYLAVNFIIALEGVYPSRS